MRKPREERDVPAEREPLVPDLSGCREGHVVDPLCRELRIAAQ